VLECENVRTFLSITHENPEGGADKHITDMESVIASLPETYTVSIEMNLQTGKPAIKREFVGINTIGEQIALFTGDAIHNLRTSGLLLIMLGLPA